MINNSFILLAMEGRYYFRYAVQCEDSYRKEHWEQQKKNV